LFEDATYASYEDPKRPDAATRRVTFKDALYDIENHLIFSNSPITVEDRQVSIHCGGVLHDLVTGLTVYSGGVELYFDDDSGDETPVAPPKGVKSTAPAPSAPETPGTSK
jgi:hypothetical protein